MDPTPLLIKHIFTGLAAVHGHDDTFDTEEREKGYEKTGA